MYALLELPPEDIDPFDNAGHCPCGYADDPFADNCCNHCANRFSPARSATCPLGSSCISCHPVKDNGHPGPVLCKICHQPKEICQPNA